MRDPEDGRTWVGRGAAVAGVTVLATWAVAPPAQGHEAAPARGAPLEDVVPAGIVALIAVAIVVGVGWAHRTGRLRALGRIGAFAERVSGLPGWAAVPMAVATVSLLLAAFGFYWDVSWHIDRGRDPGPLDNPAHWFIIIGLAGIALGGVLSLVLADERPTRSSVRIRDNWHVPVGGVLLTICGVIALAGFPLDDVWHRLFGQDVTLWGPTHIQMIGGASLATLAMWALLVEGTRERSGAPSGLARALGASELFCGGAFLLGLSTLQAEFDYGVPQFRQLYQPVLLALAASIALVAVRIRTGRGGALGAVLFFLVLRVGLTAIIGPGLGRSTLHLPLYLAEALLVELVALAMTTRRQLSFGAVAGAAIGTVGFAAQWLWSQLWMPMPWGASLLPEALLLAAAAGVAGGVIGGLIGRCLSPAGTPRQATPRGVAAGAWMVAFVCLAWPLPAHPVEGVTAEVRLEPVAGAGGVEDTGATRAIVHVRLDPPQPVDGASWFQVTAWQGAGDGPGGLVLADLRDEGGGSYATTEPVPVSGPWKTLLRLHRGAELQSVPVYLPADPDIPADEVPAEPTVRRAFVDDKSILQREAVGGTPALQALAYAVLALVALAWLGSLAWGLRRLERAALDEDHDARDPLRDEPADDVLVARARSVVDGSAPAERGLSGAARARTPR